MNYKKPLILPEQIEQAILLIRRQRVMLDRDLAALYGVETKNLNRAVRRNLDRFPADFMFQLTADEAESSRFQFGTLKRGRNIKYLPHVFTQEGVAMLSRSARRSFPLRLDRGEGQGEVSIRSCKSAFTPFPRHCPSGQSEGKTQMKPLTHHQLSTFNHQLPQTKPAGKWIERFEERLADSGFLKKL